MDFPILDLMDQQACYQKLLDLLHPDGLACPRCGGGRDCYNIHRRRDGSPVVDYRCKACRRVFNLFTGTTWHGAHRTPAEILLILRGFAQGVTTARLARELGVSRPHLLELRHQVQARAAAAAAAGPLPDDHTEADEMYQSAGEKRCAAHRPTRPAAAAGEQGGGPRHLGHRPAAGLRGGGACQRPALRAGGAPERGGRAGGPDGRAADEARGDGVHRRVERVQAAEGRRSRPRGGQPWRG
jgi:transposase-like protein